MTTTDPNVFASIAVNFLGGINKPSSDQAGYEVRVNAAGNNLEYIFPPLNAPHGWVDPTLSTVTVTAGTRTVALAPAGAAPAYYWDRGIRRTLASTSVVWPDDEGLHFFYLDSDGALQVTQSESTWHGIIGGTAGGVPVWAVYWSTAGAGSVLRSNDERHSHLMLGSTHLHFHECFGTRRNYGGLLENFTIGAGSADADAQFDCEDTTVRDEDLEFDIVDDDLQALTPLTAPVFYLDGSEASPTWLKKTADAFPVVQAGSVSGTTGTRLQFNELSGGTWGLNEVSNAQFVLSHVFATTDSAEPIIVVLGQTDHTTLAAARAGAKVELRRLSGLLKLLSTEYTPLGSVIYQTNTGYTNTVKGRVVLTDEGLDYEDWREGPQ